jgi:diaminopimelate epimerase
MGLAAIKAHAYGNDFLLVTTAAAAEAGISGGRRRASLVVALCDRHRGIGADGVIFYEPVGDRVRMTLFNADGSPSELSGNGVRCLAALVARRKQLSPGATVLVETDAGVKPLELLAREGTQYSFRANLGQPEDVGHANIPIDGESIAVTTLRVGNPQCVVLGPLPDDRRFRRLGPALATHPMFPEGANVEFAQLEAPQRVRILIWERGVGPTSSSGTGTCAAAVAAVAHGGAARDIEVVAPGGSQRVEWRDDGVYLTGWAAITLDGEFLG